MKKSLKKKAGGFLFKNKNTIKNIKFKTKIPIITKDNIIIEEDDYNNLKQIIFFKHDRINIIDKNKFSLKDVDIQENINKSNKSNKAEFSKLCLNNKKPQILMDELNTKLKSENIEVNNRHITIKLLPYCVELSQSPFFDKVNKHSMKTQYYDNINENLSKQVIDYSDTNIYNKGIVKTIFNPHKFLNYILETVKNTKNNYFIVSHSNFMTQLTILLFNLIDLNDVNKGNVTVTVGGSSNKKDYINNLYSKYKKSNITYNNLDILHIICQVEEIADDNDNDNENEDINESFYNVVVRDKTKHLIKGIKIYRNHENYMDNNKNNYNYSNPSYKHIFIMRHCFACHNYVKFIPRKAAYNSSSLFSMCFSNTIDNLNERKQNISNLFSKYNIDYKNDLIFGSSIIFRTIITSYILQNILFNTYYIDTASKLLDSNYSSDDSLVESDKESLTPISPIVTTNKSAKIISSTKIKSLGTKGTGLTRKKKRKKKEKKEKKKRN